MKPKVICHMMSSVDDRLVADMHLQKSLKPIKANLKLQRPALYSIPKGKSSTRKTTSTAITL